MRQLHSSFSLFLQNTVHPLAVIVQLRLGQSSAHLASCGCCHGGQHSSRWREQLPQSQEKSRVHWGPRRRNFKLWTSYVPRSKGINGGKISSRCIRDAFERQSVALYLIREVSRQTGCQVVPWTEEWAQMLLGTEAGRSPAQVLSWLQRLEIKTRVRNWKKGMGAEL